MKNLILILIVSPILLNAQITATIDENGKKVLLKSDGTWNYKSQDTIKFEGTGIWNIKYFVDDFGDPTDSGYISNNSRISGSFSNSATSNSKLNTYFIVSNKSNVAIKLFEYAGRNAVKAYGAKQFSIIVKGGNGLRHSMAGTMYEGGDRLYFDRSSKKNHTSKMHSILLNGGEITVVIKEQDYGGLTSYRFKFNADGYINAFNALFK